MNRKGSLFNPEILSGWSRVLEGSAEPGDRVWTLDYWLPVVKGDEICGKLVSSIQEPVIRRQIDSKP